MISPWPKRMSTIHPQTMERNHLLSQVVQPFPTTTLTQSLNLFCNQSQVSSQVSDIKGLTFIYHRSTNYIFVFLSSLTWKVNLFHLTFFFQNKNQLLNWNGECFHVLNNVSFIFYILWGQTFWNIWVYPLLNHPTI